MELAFDNRTLKRSGWAMFAAFLLAALVLPLVFSGEFVIRLITFAFIWSAFAVSWNLFSGYSGYISFGHAIFFGIGAFLSTWLQVNMNIPPWIGMIAGALVAVLIAVIIGYVTFSAGLTGIYFALSMLTLPLIASPVLVWLGYVEISIPINVEQPILYMSFSSTQGYYYTAIGLFLLTFTVAWWVQRNRLGYYLRAIKSSEEGASSLGVNTVRYKIYALSISAFLSALIGTIYVQANYIFAPNDILTLTTSAEPVIIAIAGGLGTLFGPVIAGFTLFPLTELLRDEFGSVIPGIDGIIYGIVLIVVIIYLPDGIYTEIRDRLVSSSESRESPHKGESVDSSDDVTADQSSQEAEQP